MSRRMPPLHVTVKGTAACTCNWQDTQFCIDLGLQLDPFCISLRMNTSNTVLSIGRLDRRHGPAASKELGELRGQLFPE